MNTYRLPLALALFALCLLCVPVTSALAQAAGVVGRVQTVSGGVSLVRTGATSAITRGGFELRLGDTVRTGANGRARIVTTDGRRATLGPNASVTLGEAGRPGRWQLQAGRAAVWITGAGRTEVAAPGAVAAAEGTGFELAVDEDGTSTLTVVEGTVQYFNDQGRVVVAPNQQSVARPGEAPSRPVAADASGIIFFEGTVQNLALPIEPPRFFTPSPRHQESFTVLVGALAERRPDLAEPAVARLAADDPQGPEAALAEGLFLLAQGRAEAAIPLLERVSSLAEQAPEGPTYLGAAQFRQGNLEAAEASLREAVRRQPNSPAAQAYLSNVLLARGNTPEAEVSARRAVDLAPESALAREALGTVLLFTGRPDEAAVELREALERDPVAPSARLQLAKALAASDELEQAVVVASEAVALDPENATARVTLGVLFMALKDVDRAEREFRHALRIAPDLAAVRTGLGAVAAQRGRFAQALREQRAALELDGGSAQARNNLGVALTARGALGEAVTELQEAVRLQPQYAVAHANLGIAHLELNQFAQAIDSAERAVALGDQSPFVHNTLGRVYARQHRLDRALAEFRRVEELDRFFPLQHFYLSQIYLLQGRDRDALRAMLRGIILDPASMVEQRMFARTEFRIAGGENDTIEASANTDGRTLDGRLSYFLSGAHLQADGPRANDDRRTRFGQGIIGYQPTSRLNLVLYSSLIDESAGRPGRVTPAGPETPAFRWNLSGTDLQLLAGLQTHRRSFLTLKGGYRRPTALGFDPMETFLLRNFRHREDNLFLEGRWDASVGDRDMLVGGVSYLRNRRTFDGRVGLVPGGELFPVRDRQTPDLVTAYLEWHHRLDDRTELLAGPYLGFNSRSRNFVLPKFVGRRRMEDGSTLSLLAYPVFQERNADLRPVEAWSRLFDVDRLGLDDGGWLMSYEGTWQRPTTRSAMLTATAFHRRVSRLLAPIEDPLFSGFVPRAFFPRGEVTGAEIGYEQWLTPQLIGRLMGRWQDSRSSFGSADLPYFPNLAAGGRLDYVAPNGIRAFVSTNYIGRRRHVDIAGGPGRNLGGYFVTDLRAEWQFHIRRNVFVEIRDVFDRRPAFFEAFPHYGRTILGGVEIRF
jgi:Flp pilus assembly protein TadD